MTEERKNPFQLQRIYLKDLSFEAPSTPEMFKNDWQPEVKLEVGNTSEVVEGDLYEVILNIIQDLSMAS